MGGIIGSKMETDVVCPGCAETITMYSTLTPNGSVLDPFGGILLSFRVDCDDVDLVKNHVCALG